MTTQTFADRAAARVERLERLLNRIAIVPVEWAEQVRREEANVHRLHPLHCDSWPTLRLAWTKAWSWRKGIEEVLVTMLATAMSTQQTGEQLALQVMGAPSTGKTKFCEAMLVSDTCYRLETITGFLSGWKSGAKDGKDYSLLARVNGKTLITPEGDVLASSPRAQETFSHIRRIYDGSMTADYKTLDEQRQYDGLRSPFIIAGTPKILRRVDQSELGDRFLKICVDEPTLDEEWEILMQAIDTAGVAVRIASNCSADTQRPPDMTKAYRLTGGYVDYLRKNATTLLHALQPMTVYQKEYIGHLGRFTSYLRMAPGSDLKRKESDENVLREMPIRLGQQYARLAECIAVVLQLPSVDDDVLRIVRRVAIDTCEPRMVAVAANIAAEEEGAYLASLARWSGVSDDRMADILGFLKRIRAVTPAESNGYGSDSHSRWRLSDGMRRVWDRVHEV